MNHSLDLYKDFWITIEIKIEAARLGCACTDFSCLPQSLMHQYLEFPAVVPRQHTLLGQAGVKSKGKNRTEIACDSQKYCTSDWRSKMWLQTRDRSQFLKRSFMTASLAPPWLLPFLWPQGPRMAPVFVPSLLGGRMVCLNGILPHATGL